MKKILGYILSLTGIALLLVGLNQSKIKILESISNPLIKITSIILILIGLFFLLSNSEKKSKLKEIPIYDKKGKRIIGYRRTK